MKKSSPLFLLFILCITAFKTKEQASAKPNDDEVWIELINKKDFTGWRASETKGTWTVTPEGYYQAVGKRSHLFYEGEQLKDGFKNFELEVQVRTFKFANSGIYFHTEYQETGWPNKGMEIQVNNTHIGEGDYVELKKMASLYGVRNVYKSFGRDGEWMTVKAKVESNRVQVWLNGLKTVDYVQPENTFASVKRLSKGTFCLQGHDSLSKMQYKSFKVHRLPDDVRSTLPVLARSAWHDSLVAMQGRQFAFIDLNPKVNLAPTDLVKYFYATGINTAFLKTPLTAKELIVSRNLPLFTGVKVNEGNQHIAHSLESDYTIGESTDLKSAKALLEGKKINIWSDKGGTLNNTNADELLNLAKQNNIAIEIDNVAQRPSIDILKIAKAKGCKFSYAGLMPASNMQKSMYVVNAIKGAGLTYKDQYIPRW
jgi:hypothetical protein